jgi:cell wall-associated NlpC family hydrolase
LSKTKLNKTMVSKNSTAIKALCTYFLSAALGSLLIQKTITVPTSLSTEDTAIEIASDEFDLEDITTPVDEFEALLAVATYDLDNIDIENDDLTGIKKVIQDRRRVEERRQARRQAPVLAAVTKAPRLPIIYKNIFDSLQTTDARAAIIAEAKKYLGLRYIWGGTTPKGFDCSGFTSYVLAKNGVNIARSSRYQAQQGNAVDLKKVKTGDLVFFSKFGKGGTITHVAMVVDNKEDGVYVIHSTRRGIVVDNLTKCNYWRPKVQYAKDMLSRG